MIGVINYGLGNIKAFLNIYDELNIKAKSIEKLKDFKDVSKIILPGVGSFDNAMNKFNNSGLSQKFKELVLIKEIPVIGICVGMQMLANSSEEGELPGLGLIEGEVKKFNIKNIPYKTKIPHMGWNNASLNLKSPIFKNFKEISKFYFLHSYYFECKNDLNTISTSNYGISFSSSVNKNNIYGVQFHPEKSHSNGINLLKNFNEL